VILEPGLRMSAYTIVAEKSQSKGESNITDFMDQSRFRETNVPHTIKKSVDIL
jgi:hypothetical protein